ncbi:serine hydrolase domain-containing protein [Lactobacillus jensenii]|uniref:serine hydrolase domain-containing protein n=1 Tax=Lactobacillus jensenii TaxID=109790 RepID=UPI001F0965B0|nr:serine hydrolase domain-containing protein [Lactobacillus jensenii]
MSDFFRTQYLIESMVSERIVPGVNYAFIKNNQVFKATIGFTEIYPETKQLSPYSEYDLASLTKVLGTTNVFLKLYQEGRLNFNEPLGDFLPEFKDKPVRLFHLLTHTSGIRGWIENRDQLPASDLLEAIKKLPVTDEFETKMRYADTNFILLGLVLEQIYHKSVQDIIMDEVVKPAGLKYTTFKANKADCVPTAVVDGQLLQGVVHDPKARVLGKRCGSAGLFSNIDDLIKLTFGYLGRNNLLPFSQELTSEIFGIKSNSKKVHPRSWGWDLVFDPEDQHPLIFHTGFTGTFILIDRQKQTAMIVLTNRVHPTGHNQIFLTMRQRIVDSFLAENK